MKKIFLLTTIFFLISAITFLSFQNKFESLLTNCNSHILEVPESYPKGTELYYLAWIKHGTFGQQAEAAHRLLSLPEKKEFEITREIYHCQKGQIQKNLLILNLFDLAPDKYISETKSLLTDKDSSGLQPEMEATWVKAGEKFEGEEVDFYFDWGGEASIRLIGKGHLNDRGLEILFQVAGSFYPSERGRAQKIFDLFEGSPKLDISKQKERYDGENPYKDELEGVKAWIEKHRGELYWDAEKGRYALKK